MADARRSKSAPAKHARRSDAVSLSNLEPIAGFSPEKAVQLISLFLIKAGGSLEKLKLIKLIYLADRRFFELYGEPILWDEYYSLPQGPICSSALNCIDKNIASELSDAFFSAADNRNIQIEEHIEIGCFDHLCEAEINVADSVWQEHGAKTASQLRNYTHSNCPEYVLLEHGRIRIPYENILAAVGNDRPRETALELEAHRNVVAKYAQ